MDIEHAKKWPEKNIGVFVLASVVEKVQRRRVLSQVKNNDANTFNCLCC